MSQFDRDGEPYSNVYLRDNFIKNLDAAQIKKAAERYLDGKNFSEFVLKPESSSPSDAKPSSPSQHSPTPTTKTKKK